MNMKFSFDNAAMERRDCTLEAVRQTIKSLFAAHGLPCVSDGDTSPSKTGATAMTSPSCGILSCLCCAPNGSWTAPLPVSGRMRTARKMCLPRPGKCGMLCGNSPLGAAGFACQFQSCYRLEKAPPLAGPRPSPPPGGEGASIAQMYILRSLQGKSPDPNAACGRVTSRYRRRKRNKQTSAKNGIPCPDLAEDAVSHTERSENGNISCQEKRKLHSHVQPPPAGQISFPESQGSPVANPLTPGRMGLHPARAGLYQPGAA